MIAFISKEYVDDNEIEFIYRANEVGKDCILFYLDDIVLPDDLVITMKHKQYLHYKNGTYEDRITKLIEWIEMHGCKKNFFNITNYDYSTDRNGDITLTRYVGTEENVVIPDIFSGHKVVSIGRLAFHYCLSVKHIIIPKSVISIDEFAFAGCQNLTSIVIPNTVTNIGKDIFIDSFPKGSLRLYEVEGNLYDLYKFVVYCNENSYAWKYCEENNIPHKPMEEKSNDC